MKEQLITFETAKLAKENGFANKNPHKLRRDYYNIHGGLNGDVTEYVKAVVEKKGTIPFETIDAPTQSLLQKWLREYQDIKVCISWTKGSDWLYEINHCDDACGGFDTYEEALEKGLKESLKLINQ